MSNELYNIVKTIAESDPKTLDTEFIVNLCKNAMTSLKVETPNEYPLPILPDIVRFRGC